MSDTAAEWPELTPLERRVLGVLIEKQKTTPDAYPMSLNGLVTGANQKSNRDPLMTVDGLAVEETLAALQQKGLTARVDTGRVEKWRHLVYERWQVDKDSIALLAELLLRGPQTEGELRARVSRMEPIADLPALRAIIVPLIERRLVHWLTPEGRRGALLAHGLYPADEWERLRENAPAPAESESPSAPRQPGLAELRAEVAELRRAVDELRQIIQPAQSTARPAETPPA